MPMLQKFIKKLGKKQKR